MNWSRSRACWTVSSSEEPRDSDKGGWSSLHGEEGENRKQQGLAASVCCFWSSLHGESRRDLKSCICVLCTVQYNVVGHKA